LIGPSLKKLKPLNVGTPQTKRFALCILKKKEKKCFPLITFIIVLKNV
jgi:hypothetical protein